MIADTGASEFLSLTLGQITDPSKRLFWGFIASSIVLILIYWWISPYPVTWHRVQQTFFSRRYWLTKSTLTDTSYLIANSLIKLLILVPLFGSHLLGAVWFAGLLQKYFDSPSAIELPTWGIAVAFSLTFFLLEDISRFGLHRLMHKVPALWHLHKVHHSATTLTPLTLHRIHPVEMTLYALRGWLVFTLVSGAFLYLAGRELTALHILGVDALGFLFNVLGANLRHSHIPLSFGPFERWFISPVQHQIHHSSAPAHVDKNFGTCLAIWDKLGGSWVSGRSDDSPSAADDHSLREPRLRFGLTQPET
ncbi:sterol desaturase family protein [uncultured Thalassolituus sp.]|uniref:sterol desaturase family protein n=1 Tax=uncultured Thalassolituus sp. TaxID=285273 RepID=UPI002620D0C2|nr:sterol desaturase family protein [uncultured Thalassolituus sp.]